MSLTILDDNKFLNYRGLSWFLYKLKQFFIKNPSSRASGKYLRCVDNEGNVEWANFPTLLKYKGIKTTVTDIWSITDAKVGDVWSVGNDEYFCKEDTSTSDYGELHWDLLGKVYPIYTAGQNIEINSSNEVKALGYVWDGTKQSMSEGYINSSMGQNSHSEGSHTMTLDIPDLEAIGAHAEGYAEDSIQLVGNFTYNGDSHKFTATNGASSVDASVFNQIRVNNCVQAVFSGYDVVHNLFVIAVTPSTYSLEVDLTGYSFTSGMTAEIYLVSGGIAIGKGSHSEGYATTSIGEGAHSEGKSTIASGTGAHSEGNETIAHGEGAHAEGIGTITTNDAEHTQGKYNVSTQGQTLHSVGVGTSDANRKNAIEITDGGDIYCLNIGNYNGNTITGANSLQEVLWWGPLNTQINYSNNIISLSSNDKYNWLDLTSVTSPATLDITPIGSSLQSVSPKECIYSFINSTANTIIIEFPTSNPNVHNMTGQTEFTLPGGKTAEIVVTYYGNGHASFNGGIEG